MSLHVKLLTTNLIHEIKVNNELANIYFHKVSKSID